MDWDSDSSERSSDSCSSLNDDNNTPFTPEEGVSVSVISEMHN